MNKKSDNYMSPTIQIECLKLLALNIFLEWLAKTFVTMLFAFPSWQMNVLTKNSSQFVSDEYIDRD